jgi:hypothetical protein
MHAPQEADFCRMQCLAMAQIGACDDEQNGQRLFQHFRLVMESAAQFGGEGFEIVDPLPCLVEQAAHVARILGGIWNRRLKASISARFTGPSHLATLAHSTTITSP